MKARAKIQKWGNGLAIRISGPMRDIPHFTENMPVEVIITEKGLQIKKLEKIKKLLPYQESELLVNLTSETAHGDLLAHPIESEY